MEIISSRSGIEAQLAAHRIMLPFLEGSKPPFTLPAEPVENSFLNATIEELAAFVMQKLHKPQDDVFSSDDEVDSHFFILDEETVREGSIIMVHLMSLDDGDEDSEDNIEESSESSDQWSQRLRLAGEKVKMPKGKKVLTKACLFNEKTEREGKVKFNVVRIGMADGSGWAQAVENASFDIDVLKMKCAKDGVYWGPEFCGQDPPLKEERYGMGQVK
ncbi:hypothetical protein MMC10_007840 [Thelotrema lepadinum]|nr:hypothetical protein [Thelotrema lepadinum]